MAIVLIVLGACVCLAVIGLLLKKRKRSDSALLRDVDPEFDTIAPGAHEMKEPIAIDPDTLTTPSHKDDYPGTPYKDADGLLLLPTSFEPPPPISYGRGGVLPSFSAGPPPLPPISDVRSTRLIDPHSSLHSIPNASVYTQGLLHTPARNDTDNIFTPGFV